MKKYLGIWNGQEILGKIVTGEGTTTDPALIKDMLEFPEPRNPKQALSFLGLCGVFQNYIKDYMAIAEPLYKFSCSKEMWGIRQAKAFLSLKQAMASAPVLKHADFNKDFVIFSDASDLGGKQYYHSNTVRNIFPSRMLAGYSKTRRLITPQLKERC